MVVGFAMVKVNNGHEEEARLTLENTKGVKDVYRILGEYQFFVMLQAENNIYLHSLIDVIKNIFNVTQIGHVLVSSKDVPNQPASINTSSFDETSPCSSINHESAPTSGLPHISKIRFPFTEIS
jgi:hypothetical protein